MIEEEDLFEETINPTSQEKYAKELWQRNGACHGVWMKTDTVEICDWNMLQFVLYHVYKDFGFSRNVTECYGLNVYTGNRDAEYIRKSPKMSKKIIKETEYYRDQFNPTFHPLVYKMINAMTLQASAFQKQLDPFYDKFLIETYHHDLCKHVEEVEASENADSSKRIKVTRRVPRKGERRSNCLSILTAGNSQTSGFANLGHEDPDHLDAEVQESAIEVLKKINSDKSCQNMDHKRVLQHLRKIYSKCNQFHVYTTCGYKMLLKDSKKIPLAFFLYNSLKVAVVIPRESCYHTFGGKMGCHQTTFPVTFDGNIVRYNDDDLYILAWGSGSGARSARRRFLDERNFPIQGRNVNNADITCWLIERNQEERERNVARRLVNGMVWAGRWDRDMNWNPDD